MAYFQPVTAFHFLFAAGVLFFAQQAFAAPPVGVVWSDKPSTSEISSAPVGTVWVGATRGDVFLLEPYGGTTQANHASCGWPSVDPNYWTGGSYGAVNDSLRPGCMKRIYTMGPCPAGEVFDPLLKVCGDPPPPPVEENPCESLAGKRGDSVTFDGISELPETLCISGCAARTGSFSMCSPSGNWCAVSGPVFSGEQCSPSEAPAPSDELPGCPEGQGPVKINDQVFCARRGSDSDVKTNSQDTKTETVTRPDGTKQTTTTTSTTTCSEGSCNTETTVNVQNFDGSGSQTDSQTEASSGVQSQSSFCAGNPNSPECRGSSSSFSGDCSSGWSCSGDAVECATASAVWKQQCSAEQQAVEAQGVLDELVPSPGWTERLEQVESGSQDIDVLTAFQDARQDYLSFAAECLPVLSFSFKGREYTFNTDFICQIGGFIKILLHLVAYIGLFRILDGAFKG